MYPQAGGFGLQAFRTHLFVKRQANETIGSRLDVDSLSICHVFRDPAVSAVDSRLLLSVLKGLPWSDK